MVNGPSISGILMLHSCSAYNVTAMTLTGRYHTKWYFTRLARLAHLCQYNPVHDKIAPIQNAHSNQLRILQFQMVSFIFKPADDTYFMPS